MLKTIFFLLTGLMINISLVHLQGSISLIPLRENQSPLLLSQDRSAESEITAYYLDKEKNLWIGTDGNGLYIRNSNGSVRLFHRTGDSGSDMINDIAIDDNNIWLATTNGVIVLDRIGQNRKATI